MESADTVRQPVAVYTPASPLTQPRELLFQLVGNLVASRELAWRLLLRNIGARYRQTLLGIGWAFVPPLATAGLWVMLRSQQLVEFETGLFPYAAFVVSGTFLWQAFSDATHAPLQVFGEFSQLVTRINFPRESLILVAGGEAIFQFLVRLPILLGILLLLGIPLSPAALLAPAGVLGMVGMGLVFGVALVPLGALYHDIGRALGIGLQFLMYLTPVVYLAPPGSAISAINWLNPVSPPLLLARELLLQGHTEQLLAFCVTSTATVIALVASLISLNVALPFVIERLES